jgi:nitroreductase
MHELFEKRWSARGLDASATISDEDLHDILEAGRWAPTWGSTQPVRFVVGVRGDETFDGLAETLSRGNAWATAASALILVTTRNDVEDENATTYGAVDLGLAVGQMVIQAVSTGHVAHPMAGFEVPAVIEKFSIPAGERPLVLLAVGTLATDTSTLDPKIVEKDSRERTREPLEEIAFAGQWGLPFRP